MRAVISIVSATVVASAVLDGYVALWHPYSTSLGLAEFLGILASVLCLAVSVFLFLVIPVFIWLRRAQRRVSWRAGFISGLLMGVLVMLLFTWLFRWPLTIPLMLSGTLAGAVGVSVYARLIFKPVA